MGWNEWEQAKAGSVRRMGRLCGLPTPDVEGFLGRLGPQEPVKAGPKSFAGPEPVAPFAHVGLPEPDSVPGVRTGQVCAPCAEVDFMHVAVARVDEKSSRVYFEAAD
ncbi:hypothetical protein ABZ766_23635 [Streptomyces sp. NPDC006670]|uniref:hypothetical protein n=1 Tax=Streptomyces sp. NPDC006670 TaxID=3154476 RepID=UPI0034078827